MSTIGGSILISTQGHSQQQLLEIQQVQTKEFINDDSTTSVRQNFLTQYTLVSASDNHN